MTCVNDFLALTLSIPFSEQEPSDPGSLLVLFRVLGLLDTLGCGFGAPGRGSTQGCSSELPN